jgi:hypothetical protein
MRFGILCAVITSGFFLATTRATVFINDRNGSPDVGSSTDFPHLARGYPQWLPQKSGMQKLSS